MKFQLAVNLERMDDTQDMVAIAKHTLEMVQMAERGGFCLVWAAEHHAIEMTIAPNPFQILAWWSSHTDRIRLGTGVANTAYWHPIKLAGEAAFLDLISGGRLELGIGSGAYQREFDRMHPGLKQSDSWQYMHEMLPALKALWAGDYEHKGKYWSFPLSTSVPKPLQKPHPPVWVAARAPITYDYAVKNDCHIMCWPLTRPMAEAELYKQRMEEALTNNPGKQRPTLAMMRHTAIYENSADRDKAIAAIQNVLGKFESLMRNSGDVKNGFPIGPALSELAGRSEYDPVMLEKNLMFGSPDEAIAKLKQYEALGVDEFIYYASMGLGLEEQKRSLKLFCDEVIPAFN